MDKKISLDMLTREAKEEFDGCASCIHSQDSEVICIARLCIHALECIYDCYEREEK